MLPELSGPHVDGGDGDNTSPGLVLKNGQGISGKVLDPVPGKRWVPNPCRPHFPEFCP